MGKLSLSGVIAVLAVSCAPLTALGAKPDCLSFTGQVKIEPELDQEGIPSCSLAAHPQLHRFFPGLTQEQFFFSFFKGEPTCFTGRLMNAELGGEPVEVTTQSALTTGALSQSPISAALLGMGYQPFNAVTLIQVNTPWGKPLGMIALEDAGIIDRTGAIEQAAERLTMVAGSGLFQGARGRLDAVGPEFQGAPTEGVICLAGRTNGDGDDD